jgi:hypothetical protein
MVWLNAYSSYVYLSVLNKVKKYKKLLLKIGIIVNILNVEGER